MNCAKDELMKLIEQVDQVTADNLPVILELIQWLPTHTIRTFLEDVKAVLEIDTEEEEDGLEFDEPSSAFIFDDPPMPPNIDIGGYRGINNKILISLSAMGEGDDPDHNFRWRLKKTIDSVDSYIHGVNGGTNRTSVMGMVTTSYFDNNNASTPTMFGCSNYLDSPATTSEITYTLQLNSAGDNHVWNYNRSTDDTNSSGYERGMSYITVMEVAG